MNVLITGGAGWVGRHFVKRMCEDGHVVVVDDMSTGLPLRDWIFRPAGNPPTWFSCDCRDFFKQYEAADFDLILHLAAVVGGRLKIDGDPLAVATDLAIDSDFFRWCVDGMRTTGERMPRKVIYFSSSAAYPVRYQSRELALPLSEEMVDPTKTLSIGMPDQTYGWSKLTGELLAQHAAKTYGLDVVIYRPFSGYGEDQDETYPFPAIIRRVVNGENPIVIWGSGQQSRDFIHIDDVVEAVMVTKNKLAPGEVLNLGSGEGTTFGGLAEAACHAAGHHVRIVNDPTKPEGTFRRVADVTKMNQFYVPKVSLVDGIQRSLDFAAKRV